MLLSTKSGKVTLAMGEGEELAIFLFQIFIFAQFMVMLGYLLWCGSRVGLVKSLQRLRELASMHSEYDS